jgi:RNA polymerase sigma-70 factor (ECF subfamily)
MDHFLEEPGSEDPALRASPQDEDPSFVITDIGRYFDAAERDEARNRVRQDAVLVQYFRDNGFSGTAWDFFVQRLLAYGLASVTWLVRSGAIFASCTRQGRGVGAPPRGLSSGDVEELASDVVHDGFRLFLRHGLIGGRWNPETGTSLKWYFINACILSFPNRYRKWHISHQEWRNVHLLDAWNGVEELATSRSPEDAVVARAVADSVFHLVGEDARAILLLVDEGYSHAEIGEFMRLTPRAVEARVRRARAAARSLTEQDGGR